MLGVNQLDFINYCNALKGNYRKGVHKMETLLENPTHAKEFAKNLGGVSVVLGTPVGKEDRNSETLRSMLLASDVANDAVYTWMGQYYEFDSWDELLGDEDRCKAMMANELMWRALSASGVAMGKTVATLAGLSCSAYADMSAVAASSTAMTAIANNKTAITAVEASAVAKNALYNSPLKTSISNIASTSSWTTRRNGKIWLISFRQTWSSGNTSMQHRSTLKDGGTVSCTASQSYNTDYRIDRFMDSITNYNSAGGIGNVCTYYFIPC
ncbi:MAG: hypothetical protein ACLR6L_06125 [Agathobaculum sp.]